DRRAARGFAWRASQPSLQRRGAGDNQSLRDRRRDRHLECFFPDQGSGMKRAAALVAFLLASSAGAQAREPQPEIAITIDDLPVHAPYPPGITPNQVNEQMIAAIKAAGIPVIGFVNGIGTEQHPETLQVLPKWRAAGLLLGNHTWSHPHLSQLTIPQFEAELTKGDPLLSRLGDGSDW